MCLESRAPITKQTRPERPTQSGPTTREASTSPTYSGPGKLQRSLCFSSTMTCAVT